MKRENMLARAAIKRIMSNANGGKFRVSDPAVDEMMDVAEKYIFEIAKKASILAEHTGRKTIKKEDVELAIKGIG